MAAERERERERVQLEGNEAWEEKKRARERVSTLMGQYLLKGYRMLSITCTQCEASASHHITTSHIIRPLLCTLDLSSVLYYIRILYCTYQTYYVTW